MHCCWLLSTALGLTLAVAGAAHAQHDDLPAYQQILRQNQQAAQSTQTPVTLASAAMPVAQPSAGNGFLQHGRILLQRTEVAVPPPTPEQLEAKLKRVADAAVNARKSDILIDVESRLNQRTAELALATQQELQTAEARARQYAEEARSQAVATAHQVADEKTNATEARLASMTEAELAAVRAETARKLAEQEQNTATRLTILEATTKAGHDVTLAQLGATEARLKAATEVQSANSMAKLEALTAAATAQWQATQDQLSSLQLQTAMALNDVKARQSEVASQTREYARLQAMAAQLEAQKEALTQAQTQATQAEARAKQFAMEQMAARDTEIEAHFGAFTESTGARLQALKETTSAKLAEVEGKTSTKLDALQQATTSKLNEVAGITGAKIDALREAGDLHNEYAQKTQQERLATLQKTTETKLNALEKVTQQQFVASAMLAEMRQQNTDTKLDDLAQLTRENSALAQAETQRVAEYLKSYGDMQIAKLAADTSATVASVAKHNRLNLIEMGEATNARLNALRAEAHQQSELLAQTFANNLNRKVAEAQHATEQKALKPEQVREIASQTVQEATPQIKALAMQTLTDSQNYIKTVARSAVRDGDPALKQALADAARNVIEKDGKVAFAIRQVVNDQIKQASYMPLASGTLPFGPGARPDIITGENANGTDVALDGAGLGVAGIEPAAGPSGQQVAMGTAKLSMASREPSIMSARQRSDWVELRKYRVVVHEDARTLEQLLGSLISKAEPYTGPWQIKWKISAANKDVLDEKFSLDAETTFEEFINYLAQYMANERGIKLSFSMFDAERIMVVSD